MRYPLSCTTGLSPLVSGHSFTVLPPLSPPRPMVWPFSPALPMPVPPVPPVAPLPPEPLVPGLMLPFESVSPMSAHEPLGVHVCRSKHSSLLSHTSWHCLSSAHCWPAAHLTAPVAQVFSTVSWHTPTNASPEPPPSPPPLVACFTQRWPSSQSRVSV